VQFFAFGADRDCSRLQAIERLKDVDRDHPPKNLKLYLAPETCAQVTLTALEEIGCPYDLHVLAFALGEHRSPDYLAVNPTGAVPALAVDGKPLIQNAAILKFLHASYPEAALLPKVSSPMEQWEIDMLFSMITSDIHSRLTPMRFPFVFTDVAEAYKDMGEKAALYLAPRLTEMNARLSKSPWLLGEDWSILDTYLSWAWSRAVGSTVSAAEYPAIEEMSKRHANRPAALRVAEIQAQANADLDARGASFKPTA